MDGETNSGLPEKIKKDPIQAEADQFLNEMLLSAVDKMRYVQWLYQTGRMVASKSGTPNDKIDEAIEQDIVMDALNVLIAECFDTDDESLDLLKLTTLAALAYTRAARALARKIGSIYNPAGEPFDDDNKLQI